MSTVLQPSPPPITEPEDGYSRTLKAIARAGAITTSGDTPLHFAVKEREKKACELLIDVGEDPTVENKDGESPISLAVDLKFDDILECLLKIVPESKVRLTNRTPAPLDNES